MKHSHNSREGNIKIALFLNVGFTIIEVIGGLWTNSLAILSDALHDFGDSVALITSLVAEKKAKKPADSRRTYGYQRISLFSAVFAGTVLVFGSLFILSEAIPRLLNPKHVNARGMIGLAVIGIAVNGFGMLRLKKGQSQNEKILSWHLLEDVLGWLVILIGGIIVFFWDNHIIDPIMTVGFTLFILWGAARNIKGTLNLFLQGVPGHINIEELKRSVKKIEGVDGIHDVHVWSLEGETDVFTGHVVIKEGAFRKSGNLKKEIKQTLAKHHIEHSTLEFESKNSCSGVDCENDYQSG